MESSHKKVIGIIREVKSKWERRCDITPKEAYELTKDGQITVLVQPSPSRFNTDEDFIEAGPRIEEDLSICDVIFWVKEVSIASLLPNKTYNQSSRL